MCLHAHMHSHTHTHTHTHTHMHEHSAFGDQSSPGDAITQNTFNVMTTFFPGSLPFTRYVWEARAKPCAHGGLWAPTRHLHSFPACRLDLVKPLHGRSYKHPRGMPPVPFTYSHGAELCLFDVVRVLSRFSHV